MDQISDQIRKPAFWLAVAGWLGLSLILSWVSSQFSNVNSVLSFMAVLGLAIGLFSLVWRVLQQEEPPGWLLWLTLGAALLRLLMGVVWLYALPAGGYDTPVQQAGYVMEDAYNRDQAAWELAQSEQPLLSAFQGASSTDQYGGLLYLSAATYRYLGGAEHQPLLVLVLAATVSGLAVAFTWAFSRRAWGDKVAKIAAWGLALYPEAVLLGSSQMREAFTVCLVPLALYALQRMYKEPNWANGALLAAPILISLPLTWAFTPSLLMLVGLAYLALENWRWLRDRRVWLGLLVLAVLAAIAILVIGPDDLWLVQSAKWQAYVSANASGWVERQFERMPLYTQIPFLMVYGIFRPLLPAALVASGPAVWSAIGIWRSVGWTALLAMLIYATYLALRYKEWWRLPGALLLASWIVSFVASFRGGGDQWDSPRYRSAFVAIQVALAAWAWMQYRESHDPWLRRAIGVAVFMMAWFIPWYLRRYSAFEWPIVDLYQVVGLGLVSSALYVAWDWISAK